ncbi:MAG: hypothetical protein QOK23_463, partial [Gammaproteobacteria bacterium]|nr:hypothetical protein [Gammaproteobacteria bacterium]
MAAQRESTVLSDRMDALASASVRVSGSVSISPIRAAVQSYDYAPIPGTYWMHSHVGMQEQVLMTAPLIVEDDTVLREDRQEIVLMLHDFTFRSPEEVLTGLTGSGHAVGAQPAAMTRMMMNMGAMNMAARDAPVPHMDLNDVDFDAFLANDRTLADPEV